MRSRNRYLNELFKPVSIVVALLLVGVCVLFFFLGKWQWDRTQNILNAERAAAAAVVPAPDVLGPELDPSDFGRTVVASGSYDATHMARIGNRFSGGGDNANVGQWIVSDFELDTGEHVAVLRGWVPPDGTYSTPSGEVELRAVVQPDEAFYEGSKQIDGVYAVIDSAVLSSEWGVTLSDGFLVVESEFPASPDAPKVVPPTIQTAEVAFPLQNFFYAVQWWIFALFAVALYVRWIMVSSRQKEIR